MSEELAVAEVSLCEGYSCPECGQEFVTRYMYIEKDGVPSYTIYCPPKVVCPKCRIEVETLNQQMDSMVHFGFQCEKCGSEQLQNHEMPPLYVECDCGNVHTAVYQRYILDYWTVCKPISFEA